MGQYYTPWLQLYVAVVCLILSAIAANPLDQLSLPWTRCLDACFRHKYASRA